MAAKAQRASDENELEQGGRTIRFKIHKVYDADIYNHDGVDDTKPACNVVDVNKRSDSYALARTAYAHITPRPTSARAAQARAHRLSDWSLR
ncbi:unnamed protein product [Colias eurytheme]|nr:unnamed protein product [Colias eurytheme]